MICVSVGSVGKETNLFLHQFKLKGMPKGQGKGNGIPYEYEQE